jgi:DNA-binding beta-propeller fold protein YncE
MPHPAPSLTRRQSLALAGAALLALQGPRAARAQSVQVRQNLAPHLYEVEYSAAQKAVFVVSAGGFTPEAPQSRVFRLDPATLAVQAEITLPHKGFGLALDDAAGRLYVGHALDASVSAIDISANRVLATLRLAEMVQKPDGKQEAPYGLRRLAIDPARGRLYLPGLSLKDGVLYTVDTRKMALEKIVTGIGPGASGIALEPSGQRVFISTLGGQLVTVDGDQLAVTRQVAAGGAEQPLKLAWDPAGNRLLAIDQGLEGIRRMQEKNIPGFASSNPGNRVVALEPETGRLLAEAPVAAGPVALLPDAAKGQLYVASRGGGALTVLALDSLAKRGELPLPAHPNSLAIDPASSALFATVKVEPKAGSLEPEAVARIAL